jgi:hypothetical protein
MMNGEFVWALPNLKDFFSAFTEANVTGRNTTTQVASPLDATKANLPCGSCQE